eukprot:CAMPEP_0177789968 /NCGR_PEP_ID=MMETSP0491_2-20121128/23071_1 /TAXON_ID=63592 /ORGANISM="Tetraselmis chuii, Strain PLY429" /LENGTH=123 /DNA_ID=CAMNT_0019311945 /DNA_START=225 /DNA_END=597 /DNA_ORIENTATION=-
MSTTWMTADEEDILLSVYGVSAEQAAFALQQPCDDPLPPSPAPAEMQGILQDLFSAFGIKDPGFLDGSANRSNQRHMQGLPKNQLYYQTQFEKTLAAELITSLSSTVSRLVSVTANNTPDFRK